MSRRLPIHLLVLAGCHSNPWFMLDIDGQVTDTTTAAATTSGATSGAPTSSGGEAPATGTMDGGAAATTEAVDPSTTSGGEGSSGETTGSSSGDETSTGGTSTGGEVDACTGDEVYTRLYPLCAEAMWTAGINDGVPVECNKDMGAARVLMHETVELGRDEQACDVLELVPIVMPLGQITGRFAGLTLTPAQQQDAELIAEVQCATDQLIGFCKVDVSMWVEHAGTKYEMPAQAIEDDRVELKRSLTDIPGVQDGEPFDVLIKTTVGLSAHVDDRAYFMAPRIRKKT